MSTTKTAVVTGATSGLGQAAAVALGAKGWRVIAVGRDAARGAEVVAEIHAAGGAGVFVAGDLFTARGVRAVAARVRAEAPSLDLLVNNAGGTFREAARTEDGLDRTAALNVMAPWLLTELLVDLLAASRGRVVNVVTGIGRFVRATARQVLDDAGAGMGGYVRAKLALLALTRAQQARYGGRGVTFAALHPGVILETRFSDAMPRAMVALGPFMAWLLGMRASLDEAASRYLRVAEQAVEGGGYYYEGELREAPPGARDEGFADALWEGLARRVAPVSAAA